MAATTTPAINAAGISAGSAAGNAADSSQDARNGSATLVGVVCAVAAGAMFMAAVAGSYVSVRNSVGADFVPSAMKFNNYGAVTGFFSALFAAVAMEYAVVATRAGQKTWASAAHGLALLTMAAAANLAWSLGRSLGFGVNESSYATLVVAVIAAAVFLMLVAMVAIVVSESRLLVGHANERHWLPVRSAAWLVHLGLAGWTCAWATIYLYK